jgi:hypothetical protein
MNSNCVDTELMPFDLARSILADAGETLTAELEYRPERSPSASCS